MVLLLPYQREILAEVIAEDALVVLGRGLGLHALLTELIRHYRAPAGTMGIGLVRAMGAPPRLPLVFLLNVSKDYQEHLEKDLSGGADGAGGGGGGTPVIRFVNQEVSVGQRGAMYLEGGVVIATATILVMDLLSGRLKPQDIAGLVVSDAHRVSEASREAFVVRLYRTGNQSGFLKAFSEHAPQFSGEYAKVAKIMRSLYLRKLLLWPRFHLSVGDSLAAHQPEVVELMQPTTAMMAGIQQALVATLEACLAELQAAHPGELAQFSVEQVTPPPPAPAPAPSPSLDCGARCSSVKCGVSTKTLCLWVWRGVIGSPCLGACTHCDPIMWRGREGRGTSVRAWVRARTCARVCARARDCRMAASGGGSHAGVRARVGALAQGLSRAFDRSVRAQLAPMWNKVSQNGQLLSRRGCSLPANASGFDPHRASTRADVEQGRQKVAAAGVGPPDAAVAAELPAYLRLRHILEL
jgi:hypothetical protein